MIAKARKHEPNQWRNTLHRIARERGYSVTPIVIQYRGQLWNTRTGNAISTKQKRP